MYDVVVIGAGHAGIEASWVSARSGLKTLLVTLSKDKIAAMSCNPAIGGIAKGQMVREIDALGGIMGRIADRAGIHFKMLNTSKGLAVQSPRAQMDRIIYSNTAIEFLYGLENLTIIEDLVVDLEIIKQKVKSVILKSGNIIKTENIILTSGTFLNGKIFIGKNNIESGRAGELPSNLLTNRLIENGLIVGRLKTGTPPRVDKRTIDYDQIEAQRPDPTPKPFSYSTNNINQKQINCYITHTNNNTHDILYEGFDRSPLFTGTIKGKGPRYCPSIEDKINRFSERPRHQIFLEPEGYSTNEVYVNGFSSSLPADIQERALATIPGLQNAKIVRLAYAIEYDFFTPNQLNNTLESKIIDGLYFAGQVNGTSGYEEAAAQGLIAGINVSQKIKNKEAFTLTRSEAYIGVLIDDLINKHHEEPYRMFTSRAEFRLLLRSDNADLRLMEYGRKIGLISDNTYEKYLKKVNDIRDIEKLELNKKIKKSNISDIFVSNQESLNQVVSIRDLVKRPDIMLAPLLMMAGSKTYSAEAIAEVEFITKYQGYIDREKLLIKKYHEYENKKIPIDFDYHRVSSLSVEAREKLISIKPNNLGQASRISGVNPADISILLIYLMKNNLLSVSRETDTNP